MVLINLNRAIQLCSHLEGWGGEEDVRDPSKCKRMQTGKEEMVISMRMFAYNNLMKNHQTFS